MSWHDTSPLAGTVYVDKAKPAMECKTCNKRGLHMTLIARGEVECSHIDCPNRRAFTAQPRDICTGSAA